MYGLKDWGHTGGVVRDLIKVVMEEANSPMSKQDIIDKVLALREVKPNTIVVNLQNSKFFKKNQAGLYSLA